MHLLKLFLSPAFFAIVLLVLAIVWMLRDEKDKSRAQLVIALIFNLFYGTLLNILMGSEGSLFPWKYDWVLYRLDESLGVQTPFIAVHLQGWLRIPLWVSYELMVPMMIVWYFVARKSRNSGALVSAYVVEMVLGPLLYAMVPACGPIYAFGRQWLHPPAVSPIPIRLTGLPNSFPSLHVGTAFVLVLFARGRLSRAVALLFFAATCLATLSTGEHYVIDLAPGLAFGVFAASVGVGKMRRAAGFLALVLAWSLSARFAYWFLIAHPLVTRSFTLLTILLAGFALWKQWGASSPGGEQGRAMAA